MAERRRDTLPWARCLTSLYVVAAGVITSEHLTNHGCLDRHTTSRHTTATYRNHYIQVVSTGTGSTLAEAKDRLEDDTPSIFYHTYSSRSATFHGRRLLLRLCSHYLPLLVYTRDTQWCSPGAGSCLISVSCSDLLCLYHRISLPIYYPLCRNCAARLVSV